MLAFVVVVVSGGGEEQQLITVKTLDRPSMRFTRPWMIDRFGRLIQRTIARNWWNQLYVYVGLLNSNISSGSNPRPASQPAAVTGNVRRGRLFPCRERTGFCGQVTNQRRPTSRCAAHRLVDSVGPSVSSCGSTACCRFLLVGRWQYCSWPDLLSFFFFFYIFFVVSMEISKLPADDAAHLLLAKGAVFFFGYLAV
ncbi:hypothetical protein T10_11907 [Trichinella papuae]|uniref:Uncharacterized protein n=1 Tax=Trichinella papuae TaxID=268474 RepID=A0A0V1MUI4_9BILA|nr:hypothetical protein T10_11907 [Trichinella papuae]